MHMCPAVCASLQKALKLLQPALLEDFLAAVEGFGAFCSRAQLQDLVLDCDSVRQQWEVRLRRNTEALKAADVFIQVMTQSEERLNSHDNSCFYCHQFNYCVVDSVCSFCYIRMLTQH